MQPTYSGKVQHGEKKDGTLNIWIIQSFPDLHQNKVNISLYWSNYWAMSNRTFRENKGPGILEIKLWLEIEEIFPQYPSKECLESKTQTRKEKAHCKIIIVWGMPYESLKEEFKEACKKAWKMMITNKIIIVIIIKLSIMNQINPIHKAIMNQVFENTKKAIQKSNTK